MSNRSNNFGRAYEFAWMMVLNNVLSVHSPVTIIQNSSYAANLRAWDALSIDERRQLSLSARAAVRWIVEMEPLIDEGEESGVTLKFQTDKNGVVGDVRDILIERKDISWQIGLSIKHNHDALKHSRLSPKIDFGANWFNVPCSQKYWESTRDVFAFLKQQQAKQKKWSELQTKEEDVYLPLLNAFVDEIKCACEKDKEVPRKLTEYLLGIFDYYKVESVESQQMTLIQSFNMHGALNKPGKRRLSAITLPLVELPTRLVAIDFKPDSKTTVEMYLNNGWQLSFRIHNASTFVEPSLKFDIKFIGAPSTIHVIPCDWRKVTR